MARTLDADRGVPYFATFLDLVRKRVVVVGGGKVAATAPPPIAITITPARTTGKAA